MPPVSCRRVDGWLVQVGLEEGIELDYLTYRIKQVRSRPTLYDRVAQHSSYYDRVEKSVFEWYVFRCAP